MSEDEKGKLLHYGELAAKSGRGEAKAEELQEMEQIRTELKLSHKQILEKIEHILHEGYN